VKLPNKNAASRPHLLSRPANHGFANEQGTRMSEANVSRRGFILKAIAGSTSLLTLPNALASDNDSSHSDQPETVEHSQSDSEKSSDPAPHARFAEFSELPIHSIQPQGWLKAYFEKQRDGITGNLDKTGGFPFNTDGWAAPEISDISHNPYTYEQTGYLIDGMIRCAYLLEDDRLIEKATRHTNYVLDHPDKDGYLGPLVLKTKLRWPHVVFFRALFAHWSATGDRRIPGALKRHFLASPYPYVLGREACSIEAIVWTYEREKDPALLRLAHDVYSKFETSFKLNGVSPAAYCDGKPSDAHGVSYNEMAKLGAMLYMQTGQQDYLNVSVQAYRKVDAFHMLVDGVNVSSEEMRELTPLASHETCDIADYTWTVGYLLMATGNAEYADKIERACFNAAPGAVTEDFKFLQYFSCPNQVIAAHNTNHNVYYRGDRTMSYATAHIAACCSGNVNRIMPNFAARMWMKDKDNGLVAAFYAPSQLKYRVGKQQQEITITEKTRYPFSDRIVFTMKMKEDCEFPFTVRIPGWCKNASVLVNHQPLDQELRAGSFVKIDRKFRDGDEVVVILPQEIKTSDWPFDGIALERGPLVYSLKIDEEWESTAKLIESAVGLLGVYNLNSRYPGLLGRNVYPKSPWNYALDINPENVGSAIRVTQNEWQEDAPWSSEEPPIHLQVPARRVIGWDLDRPSEIVLEGGIDDPGVVPKEYDTKYDDPRWLRKGDFVFTPQLPMKSDAGIRLSKETEVVTLVPYGCAKLRLTVFPRVDRLKSLFSS
jgi:uncharacterized protein